MLRRCSVILLALILVMDVLGCSRPVLMYKADDGRVLPGPIEGDLHASDHWSLPDVPMPEGFLFIESKSKSVVSGSVRQVTHVYQGRATLQQTADFYRALASSMSCMPSVDWKLISERMVGLAQEMHFQKSDERLEIRIQYEAGVSTVWVRIESGVKSSPPASVP